MSQSSTVAKSGKSFNWVSQLKRILSDRYFLRLLLLCVFLPGTLLGVILYGVETLVSGIEFNPQTLSFRQFSFQRDPLTNTQFTGIKHDSLFRAPAIPTDLWNARVQQPTMDRWDLVSIAKGWKQQGSDGPAKILVHYLKSSTPSGVSFWTEYSQKEPQKSAELWKAVYGLTVLGFYSDLPFVFELSLDTSSVDQFQFKLCDVMFNLLLRKASEFQKVGNLSMAIQAAKLGLNYRDDDRLQAIVSSQPAS